MKKNDKSLNYLPQSEFMISVTKLICILCGSLRKDIGSTLEKA